MRAQLPENAEIKADLERKYKAETGLDLNRINLRLLPYVQYTLMNEGIFDRTKLSREESEIIKELHKAGCLRNRSKGKLQCTSTFWACMNEILYYTYVDYEEK